MAARIFSPSIQYPARESASRTAPPARAADHWRQDGSGSSMADTVNDQVEKRKCGLRVGISETTNRRI